MHWNLKKSTPKKNIIKVIKQQRRLLRIHMRKNAAPLIADKKLKGGRKRLSVKSKKKSQQNFWNHKS